MNTIKYKDLPKFIDFLEKLEEYVEENGWREALEKFKTKSNLKRFLTIQKESGIYNMPLFIKSTHLIFFELIRRMEVRCPQMIGTKALKEVVIDLNAKIGSLECPIDTSIVEHPRFYYRITSDTYQSFSPEKKQIASYLQDISGGDFGEIAWNPYTEEIGWYWNANIDQWVANENTEDYSECDGCNEISDTDLVYLENISESRSYCSNCYTEYVFTCRHCDMQNHVDGSCDCSESDEDEDEDGEPVTRILETDNQEFVPGEVLKLNRAIGIELEMSNWKSTPKGEELYRKGDFAVTTDGSIRSNDNGREIVTRVMKGANAEEILQTIVSSPYLRVNSSCGYHIHIDTRDFDTRDIKNLFTTYKNIEPIMFGLVSPSRRGENHYCQRIRQIYGGSHNVEFIAKKTKQEMDKEFYKGSDKSSRYNPLRYCWVNFHSLFRDNNIEIRLHQGTVNYQKIVEWAALQVAVVQYVKTYGPIYTATLRTLLTELRRVNLINQSTQEYFIMRFKKLNPVSRNEDEEGELVTAAYTYQENNQGIPLERFNRDEIDTLAPSDRGRNIGLLYTSRGNYYYQLTRKPEGDGWEWIRQETTPLGIGETTPLGIGYVPQLGFKVTEQAATF